MSEALLLFVRNPRQGQVKTRLARTLGDAEALRIYYLLLDRMRQTVLQVPADRLLFYSDRIDQADDWDSDSFQKHLQAGADIGERMHLAFETAFLQHKACLLLGSDIPEITPGLLLEAFSHLQTHDLVLGPAKDGGYYLIGLKRSIPSLFEGIDWSTSRVLRQTLDQARQLGLTWRLLPELTDVDEEEDWNRVKSLFSF